ncbi:Xre family transcriptional regulator [Desulfitobacterium sp. LBE]|uniref:DNA-binding helix-turn-helix protein n=1 Tax=Desulfitobacterium hafniense TaxID=49338 RepID=A0A098B739_DESHA|nr:MULTISPECIES: helix-turn-helix transcriptional regulator [Desulfitobacterium]TWH57677.1 Xre family transcriptional regulator [Desulfitobacterium sp. LBE]CDX04162.1 DNA-binding helix-turn-helix protein [Desulfitobacterium hafniense]
MEAIKLRVAENLRKYRERKGITQKQLADHLGVRDNTISSWEKGTNSIDISTLLNICNFLEINLDDIYGISDKKISPVELTEDELALVSNFRKLSHDNKMKILGMIELKASEDA